MAASRSDAGIPAAPPPAADRDTISARISASCPPATQQLLTSAWAHDLPRLRPLLDVPGRASAQDLATGETPLHAAIRACGPATNSTETEEEEGEGEEEARAVVHELFLSGAIWNDVDDADETPGCVAWRLGRKGLYALCVEAGVRAELLFGLLDGYEALESGDEEMEEEQDGDVEEGANGAELEDGEEALQLVEEPKFVPPARVNATDVSSEQYLRSQLTYSDGKLVDGEGNGVMMAWETDIMRQSVEALLPGGARGKRILNVGFGMGIIDGMFAETAPAVHHVIEAHQDVLDHLSRAESRFGRQWEASAPEAGAYKVYAGKWQEVCAKLLEEGQMYDAIYFDTFGEDYGQLRKFFSEFVVGLLDEKGVFGFFNGLGADRRICYDVYTKVVEMHLTDAGLDVDWKNIDVDLNGLEEAQRGSWEGVKRRYWTLDRYRLPVCTFLG